MFTDETSTIDGPVRPGPSLAEWAAQFRPGGPRFAPYAEPADPRVLPELRTLTGADFPTRRAQSAYLDWVFRRAVAELPSTVTVEWHRTTATAVTGPPDGAQQVHLAGRTAPLTADLVVLAQGHLGSAPAAEHRAHAAFARRHGRFHLPPEFSADADLTGLRPGEHVVLRGFGLACVDLVTLLTEVGAAPTATSPTAPSPTCPPAVSRCCTSVHGAGCRITPRPATGSRDPPCAAPPLRPRGGRRACSPRNAR